MEPSYIKEAVYRSICLLLSRDATLLAIGSHEQAICHRLANYFETWFNTLDVDCEYNRIESKIKRVIVDGKKRLVKPDIIVHERLYNQNCLVLEAKATINPDSDSEPVKLKALTEDLNFHYVLGLFLIFENTKKELLDRTAITCKGTWFTKQGQDGSFELSQVIDEYTLEWVRKRER